MKKKILIAEDEQSMIMAYKLLLEKVYDVIVAKNGREAVDCYKEDTPDLVLMDINMPVMSGDEAIREILQHDPSSKIIAVTGYQCSEEELGVPILRKPFSNRGLVDAIEEGLAGQV